MDVNQIKEKKQRFMDYVRQGYSFSYSASLAGWNEHFLRFLRTQDPELDQFVRDEHEKRERARGRFGEMSKEKRSKRAQNAPTD